MPSTLEENLELLRTTLAEEQEVTMQCDDYVRGDQVNPYSPNEYEEEYRELVARCKTNVIRIPPVVVSQVSSLAGFRRVEDYDESGEPISVPFPQEWKDLKRQRLGVIEKPIYHAAATYGQAFVEVFEGADGKPAINVLSSLNTVALFANPVSDEFPEVVYEFVSEPTDDEPGQAWGWDAENKYDIRTDAKGEWRIEEAAPHGLGVTPIVRFPCFLDTEGRVTGLVENLIEAQDRINQTVLDLLTGQAYTGSQVVTASGVTGEPVFDEHGHAVIDPNTGEQAVRPLQVSSRRVLTSPDKEAKFGTIGAGDLRSLMEALGNSLETFAILGQMSPYIFHQGGFDNLSTDALAAIDAQFFRLINMLHDQWAENWCSVMRLFSQINGDEAGVNAWDSEVRWADYSIKTFAGVADGLSKVVDSLGIPKRGAWQMIPGVSASMLQQWDELKAKEGEFGLDPEDPDAYAAEIEQSSREELSGEEIRD
ncbi:phage portal protein [Brevibacterium sanguinis]|uniref:phage portal protein n=1 Tax=Brevibacterium sanguinis TaxID=232444 RepID=UPI0031CDB7FB